MALLLLAACLAAPVHAQPCARYARVTLNAGSEDVALALGADAAADAAAAAEFVAARALAAGGGCETGACVAGLVLDRLRRVREALGRLERRGHGDLLTLEATTAGGVVRATATAGALYVDGFKGLGARACVGRSRGAALGCSVLNAAGAAAFDITLHNASPGAHALVAWLHAEDVDETCTKALDAAAEASYYVKHPATGAYWAPASDQFLKSAIGYPVRIVAGRGTYGAAGASVLAYGGPEKVVLGNFTSIGPGAQFLVGGEHRYGWTTTFPFPAFDPRAKAEAHATSKGDITVGSDVLVGAGATVLSGVAIGHGAVVGARAVVASDVRPYAVVVGNPAREVKRRFDDATVARLLAEAWWARGDEWVVENFGALLAPPPLAEAPGSPVR